MAAGQISSDDNLRVAEDPSDSSSTVRKSSLVSVATSTSETISDASGRVIFQKLSIAPVSGQPWENFQLNHAVFEFLVAAHFADSIISLPPHQFARDRPKPDSPDM
jgi:hypothetical protein